MIINANSLDIPLADNCVQCVVTSPPYFNLRDYGVSGQIGLEQTPEEYIANLVRVFREVWRVMKGDGTLWLNIGDSYNGSGKGGNSDNGSKQSTNKGTVENKGRLTRVDNLKPKDLIGIPWMLAFALRNDGWYLRQDIVWAKPNPMPESVKDRCTKAHEYLFLLSKSEQYYFDAEAIAEPVATSTIARISQDLENQVGSSRVPGKMNGNMKAVLPRYSGKKYTENPDEFYRTKSGNMYDYRPMRNKRSVWRITTEASTFAHYAVMPQKLVEPCILAGSRPGDIVLDPFSGSGTVERVAIKYHRLSFGIELNFNYIKNIAHKRTANVQLALIGSPE